MKKIIYPNLRNNLPQFAEYPPQFAKKKETINFNNKNN